MPKVRVQFSAMLSRVSHDSRLRLLNDAGGIRFVVVGKQE
jgi:hypothetical protein